MKTGLTNAMQTGSEKKILQREIKNQLWQIGPLICVDKIFVHLLFFPKAMTLLITLAGLLTCSTF